MGLKIIGIVIDQLGGIEHDEYAPMDINFRAGGNAVGKSSFIKALQAAFAGGDNKALIRKGASEGSVRIKTSDGHEIVRRFRREKEPITDVLLDGTKQRNPQSIINGLLDSFTIDIREWLMRKDDDKAALIMESMPLSVPGRDVGELVSALPADMQMRIGDVPAGHAIEVLAEMRKRTYDLRTDENREAKRLNSSIVALKEAMPQAAPGEKNWGDVLAEAEKDLAAKLALKSERIDEIRANFADVSDELTGKRREAELAADKAYQDKLKKIEAAYSADYKLAITLRDKNLQMHEDECWEALNAIRAEIEVARANAELEQRAEGLRVNIAENEGQLRSAEEAVSALERTLKKIDTYRAGLLDNAPIPGLEMDCGRLKINGIDLSQLNTGGLLELSLDLATLRMRDDDLRTVIVDNFECLDREHQKAFIEAALERDIQVFGGLLAEGETRTITDPEEWGLVPEEVGG